MEKLKDVLYEIDTHYNALPEDYRYKRLKQYIYDICENQKIQCVNEADIEDKDVEWEDDGRQHVIWGIKENSILNAKNVSEEI